MVLALVFASMLMARGSPAGIPATPSARETAALLAAADEGRADEVERALARGASPNVEDGNGWTALHVAATCRRPDVAAALLEAGADPNPRARGLGRISPLTSALPTFGQDVLFGLDARSAACRRARADGGFGEIVRLLVDHGAKLDHGVPPALHHAARAPSGTDAAAMLIALGADPLARDVRGSTPLHEAADVARNAPMVSLLLGAGLPVDVRDGRGLTPLLRALRADDPAADFVEQLLGGGADVRARDEDGHTPLLVAASGVFEATIVQSLLDHGSDVDQRSPNGWTPLQVAVDRNTPAVVATLLRAGARVDERSPDGSTPLLLAAAEVDADVVKLLLAYGADPAATDDDGLTALDRLEEKRTWLRSGEEVERALRLAGGVGFRQPPPPERGGLFDAYLAILLGGLLASLLGFDGDERLSRTPRGARFWRGAGARLGGILLGCCVAYGWWGILAATMVVAVAHAARAPQERIRLAGHPWRWIGGLFFAAWVAIALSGRMPDVSGPFSLAFALAVPFAWALSAFLAFHRREVIRDPVTGARLGVRRWLIVRLADRSA